MPEARVKEAGVKIAVYLPTLAGGGAERVMLNLTAGFAAAGHMVTLVVDRREGAYANAVPPGVRCVELKARKSILAFPKLRAFVQREQPDVLLSALVINNISAALVRRTTGGRCRVFLSEHNTLSTQFAHTREGWHRRIVAPCLKYILPWADGMIVVSPGVGEDLRQAFGITMPMQAIGNPILPDDYPALYSRTVAPWPPHPGPTFLGVGRLTLQKDFPTLIRAFAHVRAQRPARLVILGTGPDQAALQALAGQLGLSDTDVLFPGFVEHIHPCYRMADVFVLSSAWEGFGNVLVEAMATDIPVVSTDCQSGPAFILENGKFGALVPVGDSSAMAAAMLAALDTSPEARAAARRRAEDFRIDTVVEEYLKVLLGENLRRDALQDLAQA
jgi:glycosyltransferase involved in cell wall biosynthesis